MIVWYASCHDCHRGATLVAGFPGPEGQYRRNIWARDHARGLGHSVLQYHKKMAEPNAYEAIEDTVDIEPNDLRPDDDLRGGDGTGTQS